MTATFWTGSSLSFTNGSKTVTVNTGPSLDSVKANSSLTAGNYNEPVEVKSVSGNTITLYNNWPGSTGTTSATIKPSAAAAASAGVAAQQLITDIQSLVSSASATATANSFVKRDSNGRMKAAAPSANDDVVNKGYLGAAATKEVTTNDKDITPGKLMQTGDGGIAGPAVSFSDWNAIPQSFNGMIAVNRSDTNLPSGLPSNRYWHVIKWGDGNESFLAKVVNGDQVYLISRFNNASDWIVSGVMYHSGNTNFNRFQGDAANDYVLPNSGKGRSTSIVRFLIILNSFVAPSSITTSPLTQFALVRESDQASIATSISNIGLSATSSRKVLVLEITVADSVITVDENYALRCNVGGTFIEVNY